MRNSAAVSALLLAAVRSSTAQFIAPPTDLISQVGYADIPVRYKQVPEGICELDSSVKSYSGFADVAEDQHMFWWFFESRHDPLNAPLTIWLSGGPASSSMSELFQDFGPCTIDKQLNPVNNPYSWTNESNFLFIDEPMQVGFSYTTPTIDGYLKHGEHFGLPSAECPAYANGKCGTFAYPSTQLTANSTVNAAPNVWKTVQGFMGVFPQYSKNGFNIATSSYGGHYGPVFSTYFEEQNEQLPPNATHVDLQTLLIWNGWFDPLVQNIAYYNYSLNNPYDVRMNQTSVDEMYNSLYGPGNCVDQTNLCYATGQDDVCAKADDFCGNYVEGVFLDATGVDETDIREQDPDPLIKNHYKKYLKQAHVQQALGVFTNYSDYPATTVAAFTNTGDDSRQVSTVADLARIVADNVTVILFNGDADFECNYIGNEVVADMVGAAGFASAGYANLSTSDRVLHGLVRQSDAYSYTRVFQAGHEVPFYQPLATLEMFSRAIKGLDIATGTVKAFLGSGYKTTGPSSSSFYQEGHATVQTKVLPKNAFYNTTTNEPQIP